MKSRFSFILVLFICFIAKAQTISRIDPPFWWVGMKNTQLQLLVYGKGIASYKEVKINAPEITIESIQTVSNPNYLFITISTSPKALPGNYKLQFYNGKKEINYSYEFKHRNSSATQYPGISSADLIYLLMPDRFSNGDPKNDKVVAMLDQSLNKDSMFNRHGGDLQGVINYVDYFDSLGVTALWLNPILENNQPKASYHGYAFTNHYKVDPRLGSNELYRELVGKYKTRGIKIIQDMVYNHVGSEHWLMKDLPDSDWIHGPNYVQTNYRATTLLDPYASDFDKNKMKYGWFDKHMPDLNQQNQLLATYLIQNSIWWIQYAGISGYRIDTYAYCDREFMLKLAKAIFYEYPNFGMFGEIWDHGTPIQSFFADGYHDSVNVNTKLPGITDFQLYHSINSAMHESFGWTEGLNRIYYTLCQDYLYKDPFKNVIFLDNHDVSRFYSVVNEDLDLFKMGLGFLLTTRGIPMLYYGTEKLMKNFANPDGKVREDFSLTPGPSRKIGTSSPKERGGKQQEAFSYIKSLANYRKENPVLQTGKLKQFVPEDGIYVYFRYNAEKTIMVIMNSNKEDKIIETDRFAEMMNSFSKGHDIISKDEILLSNIVCKARSIQIIELH